MIKIKLGLFNGIEVSFILPEIGFVLTTLLGIISVCVPQDNIVYIAIGFSYLACVIILCLSLAICFLISIKSKNELLLNDNTFVFKSKTYRYDQVTLTKYYVCKWYAIPIAYFYKQQVGGLVEVKLVDGEKLNFSVMYKDFLKIEKKFPNIETV